MGSKDKAAIVATALFAGWSACAGIANADPPAPTPGPATTMDHDGTYSVGTEIAPGTYNSAGPIGTGTCYWKRLSGPTGSDVVDNALTKKPQVVQIEPTDTAFKTDGCQPWQGTDSGPPGDVPPQGAEAQLHGIIDALNGAAVLSGAGQVPGP